jgi:competence protein ComEA
LLLLICVFLSACSKQNNTKQVLPAEKTVQISESAININNASAADLEKIPHIGEKFARAIIAHREKYGRFRKPEHLLLVRGISDKRFREIEPFIKVE